MNLTGFDQPYIYLHIPAGDLSAESPDIRKRNDNDEDGYGDLYISINNSNLKHWWPSDEMHHVRVKDDDTTDPDKRRYAGWPRLLMGDASATESGDPNVETRIRFNVTIYPTSSSTITVDYRTEDDSAKAGVNYRSTSGTLTFAPREQNKTIEIDVLDDGYGPGTSFQLIAEGPRGGGAEVVTRTVTGHIFDESPTFRSWNESARESGNGGVTDMNFYVSLHHADDNGTYTIDYATVDGTARAGSDYTATSGTLTFAPGDKTYKQVTVPILDDAINDSGEQFSLVLSNPTGGAQLNRWHHTVKGTILNEDAPGVSATFPTTGSTSSSHTGADDRPKVVVAFSEPVASFTETTPSVKVANTTITSVQSHTEDGLDNAYIFELIPDEDDDITFALVSNADCDSGGICTSTGTKLIETPTMLTITGPTPPTVTSQLTVSDAAASEENDSTIDFVVKLDPASDETVTVNYATADGTATAGGDYTAKSGTITFNAGETAKTVSVALINDDLEEGSETLTLTLSTASGADIEDGQATGSINGAEPDLLTARFFGVPDSHDGDSSFSFNIEFTHDLVTSAADMKDHALTVTGGTVTEAGTVSGLKWLWSVTVEPEGVGDTALTLAGNRDCNVPGAICKEDALRQLSNTATATITGPSGDADSGDTEEAGGPDEASNTPATGLPTISGTPEVGQILTAATTGISDTDGLSQVTWRYQWIAGGTDIDGATESSHELTASEQGKTIQVRVTFTDDADNQESLTSEATVAVAAASTNPLTGFTLVDASAQPQTVLGTLTDGAILVLDDPASGSFGIRVDTEPGEHIGSVRLQLTGARSADQTEGIAPYSLYGDEGEGALHGQSLPVGSYTLTATAYSEGGLGGDQLGELTVSFTVEAANRAPTGAPTISGTPQVEQTLTADTSAIADADGLTGATFEYQWIAGGSDIAGATGSSYELTSSEEGKTIQVRVTFTDDADHQESLASQATTAVAAKPSTEEENEQDQQEEQEPQSPPPAPTNLTATVNADGHIVLSWTAPDDDSVTGYQILRRRPPMGETTLLVYVADTQSTATTFTDTDVTAGTKHVYRVKAINPAGLSGWSNYVNPTP